MFGIEVYVQVVAGVAALGAAAAVLWFLLAGGRKPVLAVAPVLAELPDAEEKSDWQRKRDGIREIRNELDRLRSAGAGHLPVGSLPDEGEGGAGRSGVGTVARSAGGASPDSGGEGKARDEDGGSLGDLLGDEKGGKDTDLDSLFDLFTTEIEEEDGSAKLAASLEDVDARQLLTEAQRVLDEVRNLRRIFRRSRGEGR